MAESRLEQLVRRIRALVEEPAGISGVALVKSDGTAVASVLPAGLREDELAAVMAAFTHLCRQGATRLGLGAVHESFVKGPTGYLMATPCTANLFLAAQVSEEARLGLALRQTKRAAEDLAKMLI